MANTLRQDLAKLARMKKKASAVTKQAKELSAEAAQFEHKVYERMENDDVQSLKGGGINFVRAETVYGQVQDRSAFVEWAQAEDDGLIEVKERKANVSELVREKLDNGEPLPPGLGFYVKQYISQKAA